MNFDELEESVQELEIFSKEDPKKASVIENNIIQRLKTAKFEFPVEDEVLLNNGNASFIYKNNKTYPNLFTFFGKIFNTDIPITIGICKFGPGEILLKADNRNQALENLSNGTQEFHRLIKNIK
ncbi:MAG: hypothetical protein MRJ93_13850 [Nitrososphaeraceae archaeon]|nr:hypothetical protein [Nitrososphaeraceae archaeon]